MGLIASCAKQLRRQATFAKAAMLTRSITAPDEKNAKQQTTKESGVCGACHMPHNAKAEKLWIREMGEGGDHIERLCTSCHAKSEVAANKTTGKETHPVGVKPKESGDLPLFLAGGKKSAQGNVSCGTCHDVHRWAAGSDARGGVKVEGDGNNSFLRKRSSPESELCQTCHVEKATILGSKHDMHVSFPKSRNNQAQTVEQAGVCGICHVPHNADGKRLWAMRPRATDDTYEGMCLSCHAKGGMAEKKTTGPLTHPLGKQPEMQSQFKGKLPLFDDEGERDDEAGTVSCPTCHNAHQWNPLITEGRASRGKGLEGDRSNSFLRVPYDGKATLCSACHKENALVIDTDHDLRVTAPSVVNLSHETVADAGVCSACHLVHNAWGNRLWARGVGPGDNRNQALCTGCHARRKAASRKAIGDPSHPMKRVADARPTLRKEARKFYRKKRADTEEQKEENMLPLFMKDGDRSMDGDVTCPTCHNVHRWDPEKMETGPGKKTEGTAGNSFLRKSNLNGPKLCVTCHASKGYVVGTDHDLTITNPDAKNSLKKTVGESGICSPCHVPHGAKGDGYLLWARGQGEGSNLRQEQICLSCHTKEGAGSKKIVEDFSHPQSVRVPQLSRPGSSKYAPVYNKEGRKVNAGLIACPTCHNPHQWAAGKKRMGPGKPVEGNNRNSFLRFRSSGNICRNCHGIDSLQRYKYFHMDDIRTSDKATRGKPSAGAAPAKKQIEEKAQLETDKPSVLKKEQRKRPSMSERRRALMERRHQKELEGGL
ncbi:cytochrome c3 family protein [Pseudomonadota bacterium]